MKISVCIATYNGEKYIKAQLDSIRYQLSDDDEIIISDDSSTDQTIDVIKQIDDKRIKLFANQKFGSPVLNFEHAISKAQGEYIFLSDQDDEWRTDKVECLLLLLKKKKLAASQFIFIDKDSQTIDSPIKNIPAKGFLRNLVKPTIPGCCMAFSRKLKGDILPFPQGIAMHDWWITLVASTGNEISISPEPLTRIRRHDTNFSTTGTNSRYSMIEKIRMRYRILKKIAVHLMHNKH